MPSRFSDHRYLWLLIALVVMEAAQPLLAHETLHARFVSSILLIGVSVMAFIVTLGPGLHRWIALLLALPAAAAELAHYAVAERMQPVLAVVFHISMGLFLGFLVVAILRHVFRKRQLGIDDIFGAFASYLMIAVLWANLYALVELLVPGAFSIAPQIAWQLEEWHARRALFGYFSFAVQASIGYGEITTTSPASNTLVWMQVMAGQFYLAVVVASIVGMKLGQAAAPDGRERK